MAAALTTLLERVATDLPCALLVSVVVLLILRRMFDRRAKQLVKDEEGDDPER